MYCKNQNSFGNLSLTITSLGPVTQGPCTAVTRSRPLSPDYKDSVTAIGSPVWPGWRRWSGARLDWSQMRTGMSRMRRTKRVCPSLLAVNYSLQGELEKLSVILVPPQQSLNLCSATASHRLAQSMNPDVWGGLSNLEIF